MTDPNSFLLSAVVDGSGSLSLGSGATWSTFPGEAPNTHEGQQWLLNCKNYLNKTGTAWVIAPGGTCPELQKLGPQPRFPDPVTAAGAPDTGAQRRAEQNQKIDHSNTLNANTAKEFRRSASNKLAACLLESMKDTAPMLRMTMRKRYAIAGTGDYDALQNDMEPLIEPDYNVINMFKHVVDHLDSQLDEDDRDEHLAAVLKLKREPLANGSSPDDYSARCNLILTKHTAAPVRRPAARQDTRRAQVAQARELLGARGVQVQPRAGGAHGPRRHV